MTTPLPVTLSTFTALYLDNNAVLQWLTASESNNLGWNVYRSISQNLGQALQVNNGLIPGAGNSTVPTQYDFTDEGLKDYLDQFYQDEIAAVWYWIESIATDGESKTHGPVRLQLPEDDFNLEIPERPDLYGLHQNYPNPFNPITTIYFNLNQELQESTVITIYNLKGEPVKIIPVMQSGFQGDSEIGYSVIWDGTDESGNEVPSGIYLYKLQTNDFSQVKKMIMLK